MFEDLFDYTAGDDDESGTAILRLHVQPGAGKTAVVGRHGDALKVRVAAPPEGGRANDACRALLAETFGAPESSIELTSGPSSRMKRFKIAGVDLAEFRKQLERAVEDGSAGAGPRTRTH